jgi:YegS/Rv2252/BmrU family lipid kinase
MSDKKIHILFNPAAAGGKVGQKKEMILKKFNYYFGNNFELTETLSKDDAEIITRKLIANGCDSIAAVGGDGTINQVVNGLFLNGNCINLKIKLGIISFGTGQGFAESLSLPKDISSQIKVIKEGQTKQVDIGKISFGDNSNQKYFVNEFQLGIGGTLCNNISPRTKKYFGRFAFGFEAVKTLRNYRANELQMVINNQVINEKIIGVVIANGNYTGGGMRLTPYAQLNDGLFDILIIKNMFLIDRLYSFSKIYSAKHLKLEAFQLLKTKKISFNYQNGLQSEADGEVINNKCKCVEVLPLALNVFTNPWS